MASEEAIRQFRACAVCRAEFADPFPYTPDWVSVDCKGCGKYQISLSLYFPPTFPLDDSERYRLSYVLKQRTIDSLAPLGLTTHTLPAVIAGLPNPATSEKAGILLLSFARLHPKPGDAFKFDEVREYSLACARDDREAMFFLAGLRAANLIAHHGEGRYAITHAGWTEAARLATGSPIASKRCFAAFHFIDEMHAVFRDGIAPAIIDAGFEPRIANAPAHNEKIDARIVAEIRQARFVVADVTYGRTGVYFEAGYALGLGRPVIWTCRADREKEDMHFDTRQYNHILWHDGADLREQLYVRIAATI